MTKRFCQECGTAAEPAAGFCASCGARLAAPPVGSAVGSSGGVSAAPAPAPAPAPRRHLVPGRHLVRLVSLATVAAVVAMAGGTLILDRLGRPGGPTGMPPRVPSLSPTAAAINSVTLGPTLGPSTAPSPPAALPIMPSPPAALPIATPGPDASAPVVVAETPLGAVAGFVEARGATFAGVCSATNPVSDAGSYCAELVDDREALQVHRIGLVGSEPDTWLLVAAGQYGWAVIEWAPVKDPAASPPF